MICETSTKMEIFNSNGSIYNFYPNLPKLYTQNKQKQGLHWKRVPSKCPKWKFATEIGHFVSLTKLTQNLLQF